MVDTWFTHGYELPTDFTWAFHGLPMGYPRAAHGRPTVYPWLAHERPMGHPLGHSLISWAAHGLPIAPWAPMSYP